MGEARLTEVPLPVMVRRLRRPFWLWWRVDTLLHRLGLGGFASRVCLVDTPCPGVRAYGWELDCGVVEVTRIEVYPPVDPLAQEIHVGFPEVYEWPTSGPERPHNTGAGT